MTPNRKLPFTQQKHVGSAALEGVRGSGKEERSFCGRPSASALSRLPCPARAVLKFPRNSCASLALCLRLHAAPAQHACWPTAPLRASCRAMRGTFRGHGTGPAHAPRRLKSATATLTHTIPILPFLSLALPPQRVQTSHRMRLRAPRRASAGSACRFAVLSTCEGLST